MQHLYQVTVNYRRSRDGGRTWVTSMKHRLINVRGNTESAVLSQLRKKNPGQLIELMEIVEARRQR